MGDGIGGSGRKQEGQTVDEALVGCDVPWLQTRETRGSYSRVVTSYSQIKAQAVICRGGTTEHRTGRKGIASDKLSTKQVVVEVN